MSGFLLPDPGGGGTTSLDACTLPHLDKCVRDGQLTLLALRTAAGPASELQQLLGDPQVTSPGAEVLTFQQRFKGMHVLFGSTLPAACDTAARMGAALAPLLTAEDSSSTGAATPVDSGDGLGGVGKPAHLPQPPLPAPQEFAQRLLAQLGLATPPPVAVLGEGGGNDGSSPDMVVAHVHAPGRVRDDSKPAGPPALSLVSPLPPPVSMAAASVAAGAATDAGSSRQGSERAAGGQGPGAAWGAACDSLEWLDSTVRFLNSSALFRETVLLTIVVAPGAAPVPGAWLRPGGAVVLAAAPAEAGGGVEAPAGVLRPRQSFEEAGGAAVDVDLSRPAVCVRCLPTVVRRDGCVALSLSEWQRGGQGALLAERLVPELAYKMACSEKYGA